MKLNIKNHSLLAKFMLFLSLLTFVWAAGVFAAGGIDPLDPKWQNEYIAGDIKEIPNDALRTYLDQIHHNNPYAEKIADKMKALGPFSPMKDNIFWLPSIDVPMNEKNWRFLSSTMDIPTHLENMAFYKKGGKNYVRMFLHPFSTERAHFKKLAAEFGGFKYEFQAVTTASTRSFVAWKTKKPKGPNNLGMDFPTSLKKILKIKTSLYGVNIDGSRINPAKKMVRAHAVTRLFNSISDKLKKQVNFDFEGEWITGVPNGTDAGYVVRESLDEINGAVNGVRAEPGFSVMSPKRLTELTKGKSNPLKWITDNLFSPLADNVSYLLMEEGMIGENHTQNFDYVVNKKGIPTGKILLHDADAFRVSVALRALNGKDVASLGEIENPFFYMKDSIFSATQNASGESMTLNALMDYMLDPEDDTSMVSTVYEWCKKSVMKRLTWCKPSKIKEAFLENFADHFSKYLDRQVLPEELDYRWDVTGKVGVISLFDERLKILREDAKLEVDPKLRNVLKAEFKRLKEKGHGKAWGSIDDTKVDYIFETRGKNTYIAVVTREPRKGTNPIKGLALIGTNDGTRTTAFLKKVDTASSSSSVKANCRGIMKELLLRSKQTIVNPVMRNMGGGNNVGN